MTEIPLNPAGVSEAAPHELVTTRTFADGRTAHVSPYCPRCCVPWPCPQAEHDHL